MITSQLDWGSMPHKKNRKATGGWDSSKKKTFKMQKEMIDFRYSKIEDESEGKWRWLNGQEIDTNIT